MPGRKELRNIRLKAETSNGNQASPRFIYRGNGEMIADVREIKPVEMQVGVFGGTDETYTAKLMSTIDLAEVEATFEQLSDLFLMAGFGTIGGWHVTRGLERTGQSFRIVHGHLTPHRAHLIGARGSQCRGHNDQFYAPKQLVVTER